MYMQSRQSSDQDRRFIQRLTDIAGDKPIASIRQGDMAPVIRAYYSGAAAATINRQVFTPYAAITHYASEMDLCPYRRVRKMRVEETFRQAAPNELGRLMLANTEGHQRAYCAILYIQGWRQSDAMRLMWPNIDLSSLIFTTVIPKSGKLKAVPMDPVVRDALAVLPVTDGPVFPWPNRDSVRRWWKPLVERLGYPGVTPHQFRHAWGWDARAEHATDRDMMDANTWTNPRSTHAYTGTPSEHARLMLGKIGGRKPK